VSRLERVGDTFSTRFLHCCWVSTAALLETQSGRAWLGLQPPPPTHTLFLRLVPCIPGSRHFSDNLSAQLLCTLVIVCGHTEFKEKHTVAISSCGLFLTCRGENKHSQKNKIIRQSFIKKRYQLRVLSNISKCIPLNY
jgi:hypothetical protein